MNIMPLFHSVKYREQLVGDFVSLIPCVFISNSTEPDYIGLIVAFHASAVWRNTGQEARSVPGAARIL